MQQGNNMAPILFLFIMQAAHELIHKNLPPKHSNFTTLGRLILKTMPSLKIKCSVLGYENPRKMALHRNHATTTL